MNDPRRSPPRSVRLHPGHRNGWRVLVTMGALVASCSRSEPAPQKQEPRAQGQPGAAAKSPTGEDAAKSPTGDVPKEVGFGTLVRDAAGVYDGKLIQTTALVQSYLERPDAVVIRLEEPGAPPDGPNMFCVLAERLATRPAILDRIVIRGTKKDKGVSPCWIVSNAGR